MQDKVKRFSGRVAVGVVSLTVMAVGGGASVAQAAAIGDLCKVNTGRTWTVWGSFGEYYLTYPDSVRILGYPSPGTYLARGNGQPEGRMVREAVAQATCYQ